MTKRIFVPISLLVIMLVGFTISQGKLMVSTITMMCQFSIFLIIANEYDEDPSEEDNSRVGKLETDLLEAQEDIASMYFKRYL